MDVRVEVPALSVNTRRSPQSTSATVEGHRGVSFVPTLIARSGLRKPRNPTAITTRLIDSPATERERPRDQNTDPERESEREVKRYVSVIVSFTEFITHCLGEEK